MTPQAARLAQTRLRNTSGYEELCACFPKFQMAVDALPDTSQMVYLNPILRDVLQDAIDWAEQAAGEKEKTNG